MINTIARMKPHDYQKTAVRKIVSELKKADRAKAIMPCGTGKTLVGILARRKLAPRRSLVVAPSLALVKQLLDSYAAEGDVSRVLVVCSDDTTANEARELYDIPSVTTDPKEIASQLRQRGDLIVFSTYQSTPKIAEAFEIGRVPRFDFGLFDEAHRMAGGSAFTTALFDEQIPIAKRLFMTATPRVAVESARKKSSDDGIVFASMDDESQFGREAFYMSFNEAIEGGHLTDYRVAVFVIKESEIAAMIDGDEDARELAKRVALVRAMGQHDIRKVLTYHRTIRKMNWFADVGIRKTFDSFKRAGAIDGTLWSGALEGSDSAAVRQSTLNTFAQMNGDSRAVLNNCQVLQEGVDCPNVDAVCLIEPRTQPVDIVQIIGRAIRKSPKKRIATIVLPVFMPAEVEGDIESFVASSEFAPVWDTIAALKSHDDRVQGWVSSAGKFSASDRKSHIEINVDWPAELQGKFAEAITSRVVGRFRERTMLTEDIVWGWMQEYFREYGKWPVAATQELCPDGSTWGSIKQSLSLGARGLHGGSSLVRLRNERLGNAKVDLSEGLIWGWMQEYFREYGKWPVAATQELCPDGSTWGAVTAAMRNGGRGLPGGSSLYRLRQKKTNYNPLSEELVWRWMQEYFAKRGKWPRSDSAEIGLCGLRLHVIRSALAVGRHGLPGGSSFVKIRNERTGVVQRPDKQLAWKWMRRYYEEHKKWPSCRSPGRSPGGQGWAAVDKGLSSIGTSLFKLRNEMLANQHQESAA